MGYKDFLKVKVDKTTEPKPTPLQGMSQILPVHLPPTGSVNPSSANSISDTGRRESHSIDQRHKSLALEMVKHQVMINYLYQQQGNNGWRSSKEGSSEGIVLRLSRENYLTHPASLSESLLLASLKDLNVQVSLDDLLRNYILTWTTGCNDNSFSSDQVVP